MASSAYTGLKAGKGIENKMKTQRVKGIHAMPKDSFKDKDFVPKDFMKEMRGYGVANLPSDNMNDIMHNQFQVDYVHKKAVRDELIEKMRQ